LKERLTQIEFYSLRPTYHITTRWSRSIISRRSFIH